MILCSAAALTLAYSDHRSHWQRTESSTEGLKSEMKELEQGVRGMRATMGRLNELTAKNNALATELSRKLRVQCKLH